MNDRLLVVLGPPSGGTSAVAGALHYLGLDMGRNIGRPNHIKSRQYSNYECAELCGIANKRDLNALCAYIYRRVGGGAKYPCLPRLLMAMEDWGMLPLHTLVVKRPFEDVLRSDARYQRTLGHRNTVLQSRAADLGRLMMQQQLVCEVFPPIFTVDYYTLLDKPDVLVPSMAAACGLAPTEEQMQAAIDFVDKGKRNV